MRADLASGWQHIFAHRGLRALFVNAVLSGGPVMMTSSLLAILMPRDLGLMPAGYGLALGLPCPGRAAGSRLAPPLTRWLGPRRVLLASGALQAPRMLLIPLTPHGAGHARCGICDDGATMHVSGMGGYGPERGSAYR